MYIFIVCSSDCYWLLVCSGVLVCSGISTNRIPVNESTAQKEFICASFVKGSV